MSMIIVLCREILHGAILTAWSNTESITIKLYVILTQTLPIQDFCR